MNRFLILLIMILVAFNSKAEPFTVPGPVVKMYSQISTYTHCKNPELALAIIGVESSFRNVVSQEGSTGLMQVKPETARWIGCSARSTQSLLHPDLNIQCGCKYLALQAERYSSLIELVASYNAGSARRCKTGILYPSGTKCQVGKLINSQYVTKVLVRYMTAKSY